MELIQNLLANVDTVLTGYVLNMFSNLSSGLNTLWTAMAILAVTAYGLRMIAQGDFNPPEALIIMFKMVIIGVLTTSWSEFSIFVYKVITNLPSEMAATMLGFGPDDATINIELDAFIDKSTQGAENILQGASWSDVGKFIYNAFVWIGMVLFVGYAAFLIILSKMATAVLLAVAPIFILLLIFRQSQHLFEGWLRTALSYALIPLFVYAILALLIALSIAPLANLMEKTDGAGIGMSGAIVQYLIFTFVGFLLLLQVTGITANIAGGAALSTMNAGRRVIASYRAGRFAGEKAIKGAAIAYHGSKVAAVASRTGAEVAKHAVKRNRIPEGSSI